MVWTIFFVETLRKPIMYRDLWLIKAKISFGCGSSRVIWTGIRDPVLIWVFYRFFFSSKMWTLPQLCSQEEEPNFPLFLFSASTASGSLSSMRGCSPAIPTDFVYSLITATGENSKSSLIIFSSKCLLPMVFSSFVPMASSSWSAGETADGLERICGAGVTVTGGASFFFSFSTGSVSLP